MDDPERPGQTAGRWARLRFAIVGPLLAAPPEAGQLRAALEELAEKTWQHPITGEPVRFGVSTIERWYYAARGERRDPIIALRRRRRSDAGQQRSLSLRVRTLLRQQHRDFRSWSYQLHADNLAAQMHHDPTLGPAPSYSTVRRYMREQGLRPIRRKAVRDTDGARRAAERLETREVRSYESGYVNGLWHLDFHETPRKVMTRDGQWLKPLVLGVLDDCSRLACHIQWYLAEDTESLVHGLSQAIQKRGLPRSLMTDRGAAMMAAETTAGLHALSIVHTPTLPYSPYQNAKQESFWGTLEGRLMAMLEGCEDLTLDLLNEATCAWMEMEYNRLVHSELGVAPLTRFLGHANVSRPSPTSDELRRAFRMEAIRTQRNSDGSVSIEGRRYEIPSRYRTLDRVTVRYARWDLSAVDLVDGRSGIVLCPLFPQDKIARGEGARASLEPLACADDATLARQPPRKPGIAPLLKKLMADYSATGLPPAYVPVPDESDEEEA